MNELDVVYLVKPGDGNSELKYSLRSLVNLPHRDVVLVGGKPTWTRDVKHIDAPVLATKYRTTTGSLLLACLDESLTEDIWLFNDDFFVMTPHPDGIPTYHRGPVDDVIDAYRNRGTVDSRYLQGMIDTANALEEYGVNRPVLSYEMHTPLRINRAAMADTLQWFAPQVAVLHKRTAYGNVHGIGGEYSRDVKYAPARGIHLPELTTAPLLSTHDRYFGEHEVGRHIRRTFPDPSPYETVRRSARPVDGQVARVSRFGT